MNRAALALIAVMIAIGLSFVFASCAARADAQPFPDISHRDFGVTTCYYTMNSATGDVGALSCVKEK